MLDLIEKNIEWSVLALTKLDSMTCSWCRVFVESKIMLERMANCKPIVILCGCFYRWLDAS